MRKIYKFQHAHSQYACASEAHLHRQLWQIAVPYLRGMHCCSTTKLEGSFPALTGSCSGPGDLVGHVSDRCPRAASCCPMLQGQCRHAGGCCNQLRGHCPGTEGRHSKARGVCRRAVGQGVGGPQEACQRWSGTRAAAGCLKSMSSAGGTHNLNPNS